MPTITLANVVVYLLHVAAIAALGVALPALFGLVSPRARLFHYRIVLVVAIALPLAWSAVSPAASVPPAWERVLGAGPHVAPWLSGNPPDGSATAASASAAATLPGWSGFAAVCLAAAGLLARVVWVAVGFGRLRRLRRDSARLDPRPAPVREAVALAVADADIRLSSSIVCPVNFGDRLPTVLLPDAVLTYPIEEQRAVTCHELIHVRRHDWLRTVGDELVRAVFWFHPAIWRLLDEINLAREQLVDQEVVDVTGCRRPYLEALVKLARPATRPALRPASCFLRREHLTERVGLLLKEVCMSKFRLFGGLAASTSSAVAAAALIVWALPLQAAPRAVEAPVVSSEAPSVIAVATVTERAQDPASQKAPRQTPPKLVSSVKPVYPPEAKAKGVKGAVILEARIDETGRVADVKVLRSIPALDQAAVDALRQWRYEASPNSKVITVTIRFDPDAGQASESAATAQGTREARVKSLKLISSVKPEYPPEAKAKGIKGAVILEARIDETGRVVDVKVLRSIPALDQAAVDALKQWRYEATPDSKTITVTIRFDPGEGE